MSYFAINMYIGENLSQLGLPESKSNNSIDAVSIIESFWVSICRLFQV